MSSVATFEFDAQIRQDLGKSASRRLRRDEMVLGVVYGGDEAATPIILEQRKVFKALENDAVFSHILNLKVNGKKQQVVLKDVQRHPYKHVILHMDFLRVKATDLITIRVPLHFQGEETCIGVENGGIINHNMIDIEIRCQANSLPEHFDVDVSKLDVEDQISLSQLKVPAGVEIVQLAHGHDLPVVGVHLPRQAKVDEMEEAAEAAAAAAASAESAAAKESEAKASEPTKSEDKDKDKDKK